MVASRWERTASFVLANNATVDALTAGEKHIEQFTVTLSDGSTTKVTITITGTDDARLSRPTPARSPREIKPRSPAP
ncbi:hypothetical protein AHGSH82_008080 [Aeromonas hydrophila]|nr:hypothetical protein AHGSH82_008080 [Aeromonas hydrophila]